MQEIILAVLKIYFIYFQTVLLLGALVCDVKRDPLINRVFL